MILSLKEKKRKFVKKSGGFYRFFETDIDIFLIIRYACSHTGQPLLLLNAVLESQYNTTNHYNINNIIIVIIGHNF